MLVELDGALMTSRGAAHDHLCARLEFPEYYGRNLDALYDLLTERGEPLTIVLRNKAALYRQMGAYGEALVETLECAVEENPFLELVEVA